MPRDNIALHSFDPQTLSVLYRAFDEAIAALGSEITDRNRYRVHERVAKSIIDLARVGQLDPQQLHRYATAQGRRLGLRN